MIYSADDGDGCVGEGSYDGDLGGDDIVMVVIVKMIDIMMAMPIGVVVMIVGQ